MNLLSFKNITFFFLICYLPILSQEVKYQKGKIIDSIAVNDTTKETFALYLPQQFNPLELSPIIIIFDPMGRGKVGIKPFIKASETYGFILVCSNDSKNGPINHNFQVSNRLFTKIFSDFSIQEHRIYTSGFSGGARLASTIAILTKKIRGVVACGAGFSPNNSQLSSSEGFSYAAIIGDEDMNYIEMTKTKSWLDKLHISNELFVYNINHQWPSQEHILKAIDWLELEAYKNKIIPIDNDKIKTIYTHFYNDALNSEDNNHLLSAYNQYYRIKRNFNKYYTLDSINEKLIKIEHHKSFKKETKLLASNFKEEKLLSDKFIKQFKKDLVKKTHQLKWWKSEINKIRKRILKAKPSEKKMLHRLLYKIFALAIETVGVGNNSLHINQSIFCYDVCILIYPKYAFPYFKQAENFINKNDKTKAIDYLEKLIQNGYQDIQSIKEYPIFKSLEHDKRFKVLIKE